MVAAGEAPEPTSGWGADCRDGWFPKGCDLEIYEYHDRRPDREVMGLIERDAHKAESNGWVRFSYPKTQERLAWRKFPGGKRVSYSRKTIRGVLNRGAKAGILLVPDGAKRQAEGGDKGFFFIRFLPYATSVCKGKRTGKGSGKASGAQKDKGGHGNGHPKKRSDKTASKEAVSDAPSGLEGQGAAPPNARDNKHAWEEDCVRDRISRACGFRAGQSKAHRLALSLLHDGRMENALRAAEHCVDERAAAQAAFWAALEVEPPDEGTR